MKIPSEIATVTKWLGELRHEVVFVGGMIRSLLITDPAVEPARPTLDVDLIVNVESRAGLYALEQRLRTLGFSQVQGDGAPICRWTVGGVRVDVMPVDPAILGFSNVWYETAMDHPAVIGEGAASLRYLDGPHFCATKLEAFASRGQRDFYHHDLEDVIALVDGRPTLVGEMLHAPPELIEFVARELDDLLANEDFVDKLPGHLPGDAASQARISLVLERLRALASLSPKRVTAPASNARSAHVRTTVPDGAWTPIRSSNVRFASYDASSSTLTVGFRSGVYEYESVPSTVYAGLIASASGGRYVHRWIRRRYSYRRIR